MESSILKQIARFLQEQKKQKRWLVVFLCLAIIVGFGTVTALKMRGQAMTHKEKRVICQLAVHQHADECYDENKENLICGYADYVVHVHNEDCYDWNGNLTCQLPEVEKHEHSEECYTEEATLICGLEETAGHQHGAECYTTQQGGLICQVPEHTHAAECYDETGAVICGLEEHIHEDACYEWTDVLICQLAEGADGHTHTEACYEVKEILSCGKLELHTHTDECYEKINEEEELSETNRRLVCTVPVLEEHIHTEDAGCLETVEVTANGELVEEGTVEEETTEGETEEEIFTTDLDGEDAEAEDAEAEAEEEDAEEADIEEKTYEETKTYKGDGYVVTVSYNKDANIPEEAELIAEQVTKENDADRYAAHEAQAREMMGGNGNGRNALFKIGFYIEKDGEKKEIEPETPVAVTIQFMDKDGMLEGSPITVIHFAENGNEVLDGSNIEEGSTTFEMESFSYLWLEIEPRETEINEDGSSYISESFEYGNSLDSPYNIVFHIEGEMTFLEDENEKSGNEIDASRVLEEGMENTGDDAVEEESEETEEGNAETEEEGDSAEDADAEEENGDTEEDVNEGETADDETIDGSNTEGLELKVEILDESSKEYQTLTTYLEKSNNNEKLIDIHTFSYSLSYEGKELDLTQCDITAEITPTEVVIGNTEESTDGDNSHTIKAFEVVNDTEVRDLDALVVDEETTNKKMTINNLKGKPMALAEEIVANPKYRVQYYANIQVMDEDVSGATKVEIIDTSNKESIENGSGGRLPTNSPTLPMKNFYLQESKEVAGRYEVIYKDVLSEIFTSDEYNMVEFPGVKNVNKFESRDPQGISHYTLSEVWVLKKDKKADSLSKEDWTVYDKDVDSITFTNNPKETSDSSIFVDNGTVIRLVCDREESVHNNDVVFHDYDITDGNVYSNDIGMYPYKEGVLGDRNSKGTLYTKAYKQGINSNCGDSTPQIGFGNLVGVTGVNEDVYGGYTINKGNDTKRVYRKCSFGLVKNYLKDGYPEFKMAAPDLFSPEEQNGKTSIYNHELGFKRTGDTYTLTNVTGTATGDLDLFIDRGQSWAPQGEPTFRMWQNQFWPMDYADSWGIEGHDVKFGGTSTQGIRKANGGEKTSDFPSSDDGEDHNSYFGMNFTVEFSLTDDYVGPLNYYFFGDDDLWVFLDDRLICDIGGVHQVTGEYVNLWDWIPKEPGSTNKAGSHTLKFFYTERGASGSTCWMQYTLPSVATVPVDNPTGNLKNTLRVNKSVTGVETEEPFEFKIYFEDSSGKTLNNYYGYKIVEGEEDALVEEGTIKDSESFWLKADQSIIVRGLPKGAKYTIKETDYEEYQSRVDGVIEADHTSEGSINKSETNIDYVNEYQYELPETGGYGSILYTMAGVIVTALGTGFLYRKKVRERRV